LLDQPASFLGNLLAFAAAGIHMPSPNRLQTEITGLQHTALQAAKNHFLPAPARDAITQACFVIVTLAGEVEQLRASVLANTEALADLRRLASTSSFDTVL
jgi:hypothetical protein